MKLWVHTSLIVAFYVWWKKGEFSTLPDFLMFFGFTGLGVLLSEIIYQHTKRWFGVSN